MVKPIDGISLFNWGIKKSLVNDALFSPFSVKKIVWLYLSFHENAWLLWFGHLQINAYKSLNFVGMHGNSTEQQKSEEKVHSLDSLIFF